MTPPHRNYRPDIDGLRAIAVLLVLVFHFRLLPGVDGGFMGVDVFFVISGFLITSIIRSALAQSTFSLRAFYVARVRRLAPAAIATLALTAAAGLVLLFPSDLVELSRQVLSAQAYVANVYFWRNVNYFGLNADNVFLLHTWSLAVEEQFYLFYPLLLIILSRLVARRFWVAIVALAGISFALNIAMVNLKPEAAFYLLPTRAWELLLGAIATRFDVLVTNRRALQASAALGLAAILAGALAYKPSIAFPGFFALIPTLGTALILGSGASAPQLAHRWLSVAPLRYIGKISYPLYLVHWPMIVFCSFATGGPSSWGVRLGLFIASIAAASLLFHAVEKPVRERRFLGTNRRLLAGYGGALAVSLGLFAFAVTTHGWPQRFPPETLRLAAFESDKTAPFAECEFAGKRPTAFDAPCAIGKPGVEPRWLVVGDSHAWASRDAFDRWLAAQGTAGIFVFRHACPPLAGIHLLGDNGQCHQFNDLALKFASSHPTLQSVLLVSTWRQAPEQRVSPDEHTQLDRAGALAFFQERFAATVKQYRAMNRRVYIWAPVPGARADVPSALARANLHGTQPDIEFSRDDYLREFAFFFGDLRENAAYIDGVFSPGDLLCATGKCVAQIGGDPIYFDNSHLTRSSAGLIAQMLEHGPQAVAAH